MKDMKICLYNWWYGKTIGLNVKKERISFTNDTLRLGLSSGQQSRLRTRLRFKDKYGCVNDVQPKEIYLLGKVYEFDGITTIVDENDKEIGAELYYRNKEKTDVCLC